MNILCADEKKARNALKLSNVVVKKCKVWHGIRFDQKDDILEA